MAPSWEFSYNRSIIVRIGAAAERRGGACGAHSPNRACAYVQPVTDLKEEQPGHGPLLTLGQNKKHLKKCWPHSPLRAAARRLFYIAIHQVSLLSHAATVARRLRIDVHNNIDNNDNA